MHSIVYKHQYKFYLVSLRGELSLNDCASLLDLKSVEKGCKGEVVGEDTGVMTSSGGELVEILVELGLARRALIRSRREVMSDLAKGSISTKIVYS